MIAADCGVVEHFVCFRLRLREPLLQLFFGVSSVMHWLPQYDLTFQPFVNSKPTGASGRSICPLTLPVNRRSRSITMRCQSFVQLIRQYCRIVEAVLCYTSVSQSVYQRVGLNAQHTLSHWSTEYLGRLPSFCMVLMVARPAPVAPNIYQRSACGQTMRSRVRWRSYRNDDGVRKESLEGNRHDAVGATRAVFLLC